MSGTEKRNHPGHLGAWPPKDRVSRSPSPLSAHASGSGSNQPSSLAFRSQQQHRGSIETRHTAFNKESYGTTPSYELPADGMFSPLDSQPTSRLGDNRSHSVPPKIFVHDQVGHASAKRMPPQIDTNVHLSRRDSLMDESAKRPTSPHITSATPTNARHNLHFGGASRRGSGHDPDFRVRPVRSPGPNQIVSPSILPAGLGRAAVSAAHSIMDAVAGRASPLSARLRPNIKERNSLSDDEEGKGHGRKPAGRHTPSSQPHHYHKAHFVSEPDEIIQGVSGNVEWRTSISESRRGTPAAYRPRPGSSEAERKHDVRGSVEGRLPGSHHSTHSSILIGSPIVVPQARRGAVRLRPRRRRRVIRPVQPQLSLRQKILIAAASMIHLLRLLASPVEAAHRFKEWWLDTKISMDESFRDPRTGVRSYYPPWLQAYVPLLVWLLISLSSTALVITFHTEVFVGLDHLATYLQSLGFKGKLMLGSFIFLTTFPPLPLYSTLIMLCGFTFGLWQGFIISYIAALTGAIVVFVLSRSLLKDWMVGLLNKSGGLKKVVRAIEKQPKLLFLVRLAPYPYNLMNTLLASSQTLSLRTYVTCTALALPKLLIHTGLGTSIKNFAAYNGAGDGEISAEEAQASQTAEKVKKWAGLIGLGLCIGIMVYLLSVARRAVDDLDDDDDEALDGEDQDLLFSEFEEDDEMGETDGGRKGSEDVWKRSEDGTGTDMLERAGPTSLGFRNGYAAITASPEERLRHTMRQPAPTSGALGMPLALGNGSGPIYMDDRVSQSNHSGSAGDHSIDLAERIAEMEAHAEGMQFGTPMTSNTSKPFETPYWSPMLADRQTGGYSDEDEVGPVGHGDHFKPQPYRAQPRTLFLDQQHEYTPHLPDHLQHQDGDRSD